MVCALFDWLTACSKDCGIKVVAVVVLAPLCDTCCQAKPFNSSPLVGVSQSTVTYNGVQVLSDDQPLFDGLL